MSYVTQEKRKAIDALLALGLKRCARCDQTKSISDFNRLATNRTGLSPECKDCRSLAAKAEYQKYREARLGWQRAFNKTDHRRTYNRNYQRNRFRCVREASADRPRPMVCEVCGQEGPVFYDHDHSTGKRFGKFRGWLCNGCNSALGWAKEDSTVLRKLADYIEKWRAK